MSEKRVLDANRQNDLKSVKELSPVAPLLLTNWRVTGRSVAEGRLCFPVSESWWLTLSFERMTQEEEEIVICAGNCLQCWWDDGYRAAQRSVEQNYALPVKPQPTHVFRSWHRHQLFTANRDEVAIGRLFAKTVRIGERGVVGSDLGLRHMERFSGKARYTQNLRELDRPGIALVCWLGIKQ